MLNKYHQQQFSFLLARLQLGRTYVVHHTPVLARLQTQIANDITSTLDT